MLALHRHNSWEQILGLKRDSHRYFIPKLKAMLALLDTFKSKGDELSTYSLSYSTRDHMYFNQLHAE
jgi:hypothetical protein